ncbi:opioid growth factor receptor [Brienomyrus brachyistius]|uniref:opioid growth factor receptor n=1 Tax=Brienomyrus brachyistius TaxID=42636 RepID=UPI0020B18C2B|nr:opioid growth factor receptor [Brienomyrus brachyistius]
MEDDLVCEYDSTWDTESDGDDLVENVTRRSSQDKTQKSWGFWSNPSSRNLRAAKDMQNYRRGYPNIQEEENQEERMNNLKFYLNEITSSPDEVSIEAFHKEWKMDYKRLERVHSYIQWLFPLREPGVNYMASELTKKEIQEFRKSEEAKRKLMESYELMLGFYGIQLFNKETGEVKRAENWRERFANLERNMHNNLRITRILKSLGELGFEHYQAPLVHFFLEETLVRKNLSTVKRSVLDYFVFAVRDKKERRTLIKYAFQHYEPKDKFVWCPRKIQKRLKKKSEKKQEVASNRETPTSEEVRSKNVAKGGEALSARKEEKSPSNPADTQKLNADEASTDSSKLLEGSSVDLEPSTKMSDDQLVLDQEEMDQSGSTECSLEKNKDEKKEEEEEEEESLCRSNSTKALVPDPTDSETAQEKQAKKKKEESAEDSNNCMGEELPSNQLERKVTESPVNGPMESQECPPSAESRRTAREGPGNVSPPPEERRAEKQPRTDFGDLSHAISNGEMPDTANITSKDACNGSNASVQSSVTAAQENSTTAGNKWTNGTNGHNCSEPMDTESVASTDMEVEKL